MTSIVACIPLFNGEKYIRTAIHSIMSQTRPPDEIVVVDDGSSDAGPNIVAEYAKNDFRVRLERKPNGGQSSARNLGVARSSSDLIAFLDQDDWWYPNHLEVLEKAAADYGGPAPFGWTYSDLDEYDVTGRLFVRRLLTSFAAAHPKTSIYECLGRDMYVLPSASLISRSAFEAVGGFDERLMGYEDDDLFLRMFVRGYANIFVPQALSAWRIHGASASHTTRMTDSALIYFEKLSAEFPNDPTIRRYLVRDLVAPRFLAQGFSGYSSGTEFVDRKMVASSLALMDKVARGLPLRRGLIIRLLLPLLRVGAVQRLASIKAARVVANGWLRRAGAI
jgi:glycosyltransferase involved in cell wall biosynthesis